MRLDTLLEYLLREAKLAPEAPEGSPLGQYLFAQDRRDVPYEQNETGPTEENPKAIDENELEAQLFNHYKGAGDAGFQKRREYISFIPLARELSIKLLLIADIDDG